MQKDYQVRCYLSCILSGNDSTFWIEDAVDLLCICIRGRIWAILIFKNWVTIICSFLNLSKFELINSIWEIN